MPKFLEAILKKKYGANSDIPYKIMNAKGFMHGNKETAKGRAAEAKHERDKGTSVPGAKDAQLEAHDILHKDVHVNWRGDSTHKARKRVMVRATKAEDIEESQESKDLEPRRTKDGNVQEADDDELLKKRHQGRIDDKTKGQLLEKYRKQKGY